MMMMIIKNNNDNDDDDNNNNSNNNNKNNNKNNNIIIIIMMLVVFLERLSMRYMLSIALNKYRYKNINTCIQDTQNSTCTDNHAQTSN